MALTASGPWLGGAAARRTNDTSAAHRRLVSAAIALLAHAAVLLHAPAASLPPPPALDVPVEVELSEAANGAASPVATAVAPEPPPLPTEASPALPPPEPSQPKVQLAEPPPVAAPEAPARRRSPAPPRPPLARASRHPPQFPAPTAQVEPHEAEQHPGEAAHPVTEPAAPAAMAADPNAVPGWQGRLVALLQRAKRYPDLARSAGDEGVALVSFTMDRAGHVLSVRVVRSAGDPALDEEAVALVHRAEPLPPPPAEMPGGTITLSVPIRFSLQ